ncbi:MAG: hypothetical protein KAT17_02440 [Candidatus Aminicenantes bacterium]|nr:hypothetical protein [Candidatus Aminicenantes bacterium]
MNKKNIEFRKSLIYFCKGFIVQVILISVTIIGCNDISNYSGHYYVTVGPNPAYIMDIDHSEHAVSFRLLNKEIDVSGTGTVDDNRMELSGEISGIGLILLHMEFSDDDINFSGTWEFASGTPMTGTVTGSQDAWVTYDVENDGVPQFANSNCIDLDKIDRISRFRSGEGHDYSDDFEDCRSMKHYFHPKNGVNKSTVKLYSPVNGTIIGWADEWEGNTLWKGTVVGIQPDGLDAFSITIYHINLNSHFKIGNRVTSGQELGHSEKKSGTVSDIAIWVHSPYGNKLISYFEVMTEDIFQMYQIRGIFSREQTIISKANRDNDPLQCVNGQFVDRGNLENWVYLD